MKRPAASMLALLVAAAGVVPSHAASLTPVTFEQTIADLRSADADARFRAVQLLGDAAYPEAAVPLAAAINDTDDDVQAAAIAAELNIFLADKVTSRRRVAFVIERRGKIAADASFSAGRSAFGTLPVPRDVATALCGAIDDDNPRVALEALYAFGTLAPEVPAADRDDVLRTTAPQLAALLGAPGVDTRLAALRVAARVYERRPGDGPVDEPLGDAIITTLNDPRSELRLAAMDALGRMRYDRAVGALGELFAYYRRGAPAEHALDALAHIGNRASTPLFLAQLSGNSAALKTIAIEGLARVGDASAAPAIGAAIADEQNDAVLLAAAFARATLAHDAIDAILDALAHPKLHDQAFAVLIELAPGRSRSFVQGGRDPDARVRADVADILGLGGDAAALPAVQAMATDADPLVARAAARAVARLRTAAPNASEPSRAGGSAAP